MESTSGADCKNLYEEEILKACDVVIRLNDAEFPVNKNALCDISPYFLALFERWSFPDQRFFTISSVPREIMQTIVEFTYTGIMNVTEDNVQDILRVADYLNMCCIVEACHMFLEEHLRPENCIGVWHLTTIHSPAFKQRVYHYILLHFGELVFTNEFTQLTVQELLRILDDDVLYVRDEREVFEAVIHWISLHFSHRIRYIYDLMAKVRLALLSLDYITTKVLTSRYVQCDMQTVTMAHEAIRIIDHISAKTSDVSGFKELIARPRLPKVALLALGGCRRGKPTNYIEAYDKRADRWVTLSNILEQPRSYHGIVFLDGYVYCIGGCNENECFRSVHRFHLRTGTWEEVASMDMRRCYVSVTVFQGCIYALGGSDGRHSLRTCECYTPEDNQWTRIASMLKVRRDASCTVFHNKIYICGGCSGINSQRTAEYYDRATNQWTLISPMISRRSGIAVFAYGDHIYAAGGYNGQRRLRSVEAYNPRIKSWYTFASMLSARSNFAIEVVDDRVYAVGGINILTKDTSVEYYDMNTKKWTPCSEMGIIRKGLGCCVVSGVPNLSDYLFSRDSLPSIYAEDSEDDLF
ncbi:kelch-like protein 10 [Neosynchiropus ocellatus]